MTVFKRHAARHRAETTSHAVRNTTIAATAGAVLIGSIAPAQAYAEVPAETAPAYATPASALTTYTSAASQPAAAPQTVSTASSQAPAAPEQATSAVAVSTQSADITEITGDSGIVGTAMQGAGTGYVWAARTSAPGTAPASPSGSTPSRASTSPALASSSGRPAP